MTRTGNAIKLRAHSILDDVKHGIYHPAEAIRWALRMTGDLV